VNDPTGITPMPSCPECGRPNMESTDSGLVLKCWWCGHMMTLATWYRLVHKTPEGSIHSDSGNATPSDKERLS